jgi:N-acetylneuraminic acid mutarotase
VQILDVAAGTWTYGESLPEPTDWATAAWVAGALHLIGGVTNQSGASTQHLVYDRLGNSWSPAPAVPSAIAGTAGLSDGSRIYVFAGNSGSSPAHTSTTRIYDVASQGWTTALAVPSPRINWSGTYHRERFYLIGGGTPGIGTSDELLSYDPQANDWTVLRRIPLPREAHGVATALERVCAIGGRLAASGNFNTPYADVSCYDPATDTWAPAPALPRPLQEVAAVSVNGTIVAVGGADGSNLPVADVSALRVR